MYISILSNMSSIALNQKNCFTVKVKHFCMLERKKYMSVTKGEKIMYGQ